MKIQADVKQRGRVAELRLMSGSVSILDGLRYRLHAEVVGRNVEPLSVVRLISVTS